MQSEDETRINNKSSSSIKHSPCTTVEYSLTDYFTNDMHYLFNILYEHTSDTRMISFAVFKLKNCSLNKKNI